MIMKILILGHRGMLGNAVYRYFTTNNIDVETLTDLRWDSNEFKHAILNSNANFIINCIGAIPQKKPTDDYYELLNVQLPLFLESTGKKILHPSTDCIFSGKLEYPNKYKKNDNADAYDLYGKSKAKIDRLIQDNFLNTKMIRTSIFGHELFGHVSLLDWFLNTNDDEVINGYSNYYWNGISTLQWSKEADKLLGNWNNMPCITQLGSCGIPKSEFLKIVAKIYGKTNQINDFKMVVDINKMLESDYDLPSIEEQLIELKEFYENV